MRSKAVWLAGCWLVCSGLAVVGAQPPDQPPPQVESGGQSEITLQREDRTIRVVQQGRSVDGARFIPSNRGCEEGIRLSTFFAPEPGFVETFINDMRITSAVALVRNPDAEESAETLELHTGTVGFSDRRCPENMQPAEDATITIFEGRSTVVGRSLDYDNSSGQGTVAGPVTLQRAAEGSSAALNASSESMAIDSDSDKTILRNNVRVESDGRTSEADELEYDEQAGIGILRGNPARSRRGDETVEGQTIEYDLDSNDVIVVGGAKATFTFERNRNNGGSNGGSGNGGNGTPND